MAKKNKKIKRQARRINIDRQIEDFGEEVGNLPNRTKRHIYGPKRLYRSGKDKILGGVCGGIAEYINVDPVIIRLLWIFALFAWGIGILPYIIAWIIIPRNPRHKWS